MKKGQTLPASKLRVVLLPLAPLPTHTPRARLAPWRNQAHVWRLVLRTRLALPEGAAIANATGHLRCCYEEGMANTTGCLQYVTPKGSAKFAKLVVNRKTYLFLEGAGFDTAARSFEMFKLMRVKVHNAFPEYRASFRHIRKRHALRLLLPPALLSAASVHNIPVRGLDCWTRDITPPSSSWSNQ